MNNLATVRKEANIKAKCREWNVAYVKGQTDETEEGQAARHRNLRNKIRTARRNAETDSRKTERKQQEREYKQNTRANESAVDSIARRKQDREYKQNKRANESEVDSIARRKQDREYKQSKRANESEGDSVTRRMHRREVEQSNRDNETESERDSRRKRRREDDRCRRVPKKQKKMISRASTTSSETTGHHNKPEASTTHDTLGGPDSSDDEDVVPIICADVLSHDEVIKRASKFVTRTQRSNGMHQATVCVVCDRFIIGTEKICYASKKLLLENKERLSVETFEKHFRLKLNSLLISQYQLDDKDLHGMLLSPRAFIKDDSYECCQSCRDSMTPSKTKKAGSCPPKHAIANGFAIGHIPSELYIVGEDKPRRINLTDCSISDIMNAAVALQRPYAFVFAFVGGAHQSVMGQYSFFETDQTHVGTAMNEYRMTGANDHILVVLSGRMTPKQKEIARKQASLDSSLYIDLITWLITTAQHSGFKDVIPPETCSTPKIIVDSGHNVEDEPKNPEVENKFEGGTYTFASSQDPSESTGVYVNQTSFKLAMLDRTPPTALVSGGKYISSGHELRLEDIFPLVFPFGIGGKMDRPTKISETECLKHYLRLSLPAFMRGDVILVLNHMFNRIQSYKSGIIKCRTKKFGGKPFAEAVATLTEEEIDSASRNLANKQPDSSLAAEFIKQAEASCSAIGYTEAASRSNRKKIYAMCDRFGIPNIFFTLTPCDECSFRVRVWTCSGYPISMMSMKESDDTKCIADFKLRRKARMQYPGACAIEYQSIVQITIKVLFGWDCDKQEGSEGIFGELLAFACGHEEQGRKTLHGHWLIWVRNINKLRKMLFHPNEQIRLKAKCEIEKYADKIMSSSFGDFELVMTPRCDNEIDNNPSTADQLFYDYKPGSSSAQDDLQRIRDARNKECITKINGEILHSIDPTCAKLFSTEEIVNMSLQYHLDQSADSTNVHLPIHKNRLDRATYGYIYDYPSFSKYDSSSNTINKTSFWDNADVRALLLRMSVDQHDPMHRRTCFKKDHECRFGLPDLSCEMTEICIDDATDNMSNVTTLHRLDAKCEEDLWASRPYILRTRRPMGCQYLNTHSIPASAIFGCNTNVQFGSVPHAYYTTLYTSKNTQKDDAEKHRRIGIAVCRRLWRMREIVRSNNLDSMIAQSTTIEDPPHSSESDSDANWTEGLSRVLSGMCATLTKSVCSSPLAHLIMSLDGSRFQYSHGFTPLLVRQALDALDEKDTECRIRINWSKKTGKVLWPDSVYDDYIHRPVELESLSFYEYNARYLKVCKKWKEIDNNDEEDEVKMSKFRFLETHPGYEFSYLIERKCDVIPIIYLSEDYVAKIEDLEMFNKDPSDATLNLRENYGKAGLVMFYPFRSIQDITSIDTDSETVSFWEYFMKAVNEKLIWKEGLSILHNMNDKIVAHKMKSATAPLVAMTTKKELQDKSVKKQEDLNAIDFSEFDVDICEEPILEGYTNHDRRTHDHLISSSKVDTTKSIQARLSSVENLLIEAKDSRPRENNSTSSAIAASIEEYEPHTLVQFISGALVGGSYDSYTAELTEYETQNDSLNVDHLFDESIDAAQHRAIPSMKGVAMKVAKSEGITLDEKQYAAYEIISCSFLLNLIDESMCVGRLTEVNEQDLSNLRSRLIGRGGREQLIMFLCGFAGAGKSSCVNTAQRFCFEFCRSASIPWNTNSFLFTATTGSAAALFGGQTIHDAAFLEGMEKNISDEKRNQWQNVHMLIIDEISFFTPSKLQILDERLKNFLGRYNVPFGGLSIVFSGDFHQLKPVAKGSGSMLYEGLKSGLFESSVNVAIILEESHRFDADPEYGELLKRLWKGEMTKDDVDLINQRVVGTNGLTLPDVTDDSDITYACPHNNERNAISASIFKQMICKSGLFPDVNSTELPPNHTIIIEADIQSMKSAGGTNKKTKVSPALSDRIRSTCGDADCTDSSNKKIDPCLRVYLGAHVMCIDNSKLKTDQVGNGTLCRVVGLKLIDGAPQPQWKNWDGHKVLTINARHVEYIELERFPESKEIKSLKAEIEEYKAPPARLVKELTSLQKSRRFQVAPNPHTVTVKVSLDDRVPEKMLLSGVKLFQLPINMNDATTGHKLQGMSKDQLIVAKWSEKFPNWIYVILSRVRTRYGLYLLEPLSYDCLDKISVPRELAAFESRMKLLEHNILESRRRYMDEESV